LADNQRLALCRLADGESMFGTDDYETFLGLRGLARRGLAVRLRGEGNRVKWALTEAGAAVAARTSRPSGWEKLVGISASTPYRPPRRYAYRGHVIEVRHEARERASAVVIAPGRGDRVVAQLQGTTPHDCLRQAREHVDTLAARSARR
jgi:hypothetical protein